MEGAAIGAAECFYTSVLTATHSGMTSTIPARSAAASGS
jgi:hypothetical protein